MQVMLTDGTLEQYDDEAFTSGGQGTLHLSKDKRWVIKLYHSADSGRIAALSKIIGDYNVAKDANVAHLFAWPNAIVRSPKLGVRMRNVNLQLEHRPLAWWILGRAMNRLSPAIRGNWLDRTRVAVNMARIAWQLHGYGLCHSDFSSDNFLANVAQQHVVLIDLDSLVVPGVLPPEMLGTGDYMAPEIVVSRAAVPHNPNTAKPSIYTDLHSLAVLIYELLLMRHPLRGPKQHDLDSERDELMALGEKALYVEDPDDRSNRPADPFYGAWLLGDEVEGLMRRAFTVGLRTPARRPQAAEWGDALGRLADQTIPCPNPACSGGAFVLLRNQPAICPWCLTKIERPAQVPILQLFDNVGQPGHYQPAKGRIVGWQQRTLHRWHIQSDSSERTARQSNDDKPLAEVRFNKNKWTLTNLDIPELRVAGAGAVKRVALQETVLLESNQRLILSAGQAARVALVTMQSL